MLSFEKETEKILKSIDFLLDTDYNYKRCKYAGMAELAVSSRALPVGRKSEGEKAAAVEIYRRMPKINFGNRKGHAKRGCQNNKIIDMRVWRNWQTR